FRRAVNAAKRENARLQGLIPRLSIDLRQGEPGHVLLLNEQPLPRSDWAKPRKVDPGSYTVVVKRGSNIELSERIELEPGATLNMVLSLTTRDPEPAEPRAEPGPTPRSPVFAWTSLGVGAAGLATGLIAGAVMLDAKSDLDSRCQGGCPPGADARLDRF